MIVYEHPELRLPDSAISVFPIEGEPSIEVLTEFTIPGLAEGMSQRPESLWLGPDLFSELGVKQYSLEGVTFHERREWEVGRTNSEREVFFGELEVELSDQDRTIICIPVACKPYHADLNEGVHEYAALTHINNTDNIETFYPLGFWNDSEGNTFLLTRFDEDVQSFDNIDWSQYNEEPDDECLTIPEALRVSASIFANLHGNGFVWRDGESKNVAISETGPRVTDLEQLRLFRTPENPNSVSMREEMLQDVMDFIKSIMRAGFMADEPAEKRSQVLRDNLVEPYKSNLLHPSMNIEEKCGIGAAMKALGVCAQLEYLVGHDDVINNFSE